MYQYYSNKYAWLYLLCNQMIDYRLAPVGERWRKKAFPAAVPFWVDELKPAIGAGRERYNEYRMSDEDCKRIKDRCGEYMRYLDTLVDDMLDRDCGETESDLRHKIFEIAARRLDWEAERRRAHEARRGKKI